MAPFVAFAQNHLQQQQLQTKLDPDQCSSRKAHDEFGQQHSQKSRAAMAKKEVGENLFLFLGSVPAKRREREETTTWSV